MDPSLPSSGAAISPASESVPAQQLRKMGIAFLALVLIVDLTLVTVIGIGILTVSGEGIVTGKLLKYHGSPSLKLDSGTILPAVGAYYAIEPGDRVKKSAGTLTYEVNGQPVNALLLYAKDLVRFTLPMTMMMLLLLLAAIRLKPHLPKPHSRPF